MNCGDFLTGSTDLGPERPEPGAATLLHDAPCGFLVIDRRERVHYANSTLERWTNRPSGALSEGVRLKDVLTHASHFYYQTQIAPMIQLQGFAREISCKLRIEGHTADLPVLMNAALRGTGDDSRIDIVFFDATERLQFEHQLRVARAEAEELAAIVRNASVGVLRCTAEGKIKRYNSCAAALLGLADSTVPDRPINALLPLETEAPDWYAHALDIIAETRKGYRFEAACGEDVFNISVSEIDHPEEPLAVSDYSLIVRDVTERVRAERRLNLLIGELNHRIRNVFSVVTGLVRQTIRSAPSERDTLVERLQSVSASHDILTQNYWKDAEIRELTARMEAQISDSQQVIAKGPDVRLVPRQFKALSMALHELSTNARKYGALSADFGVIEIDWSLDEDDGFVFRWRERGGPKVSPPDRTGFGTVMIERVLAEEFSGVADVSYAPEGLQLVCRGALMRS